MNFMASLKLNKLTANSYKFQAIAIEIGKNIETFGMNNGFKVSVESHVASKSQV